MYGASTIDSGGGGVVGGGQAEVGHMTTRARDYHRADYTDGR